MRRRASAWPGRRPWAASRPSLCGAVQGPPAPPGSYPPPLLSAPRDERTTLSTCLILVSSPSGAVVFPRKGPLLTGASLRCIASLCVSRERAVGSTQHRGAPCSPSPQRLSPAQACRQHVVLLLCLQSGHRAATCRGVRLKFGRGIVECCAEWAGEGTWLPLALMAVLPPQQRSPGCGVLTSAQPGKSEP